MQSAHTDELPELGDVSRTTITSQQERQLGEQIMRQIRASPMYLDEPEVTDYINALGYRLVVNAPNVEQQFEFFVIQDNTVNAFALPGGFIGVHTGLITTAQSESELAAVLSHEIGHVTQRHIARLFTQQKQAGIASMAALALAILAARSSPDLAQAAVAGAQYAMYQTAVNFTRDNEREADRVGLQIMEASGFDPRAMPAFFERLQRATRIYEGGAPSYLRTHPLTSDRIADIENRVDKFPYRQVPDSLDFQLVRAKLKADLESPRAARTFFEDSLSERRYLSEAASRYGLARSLLRLKDIAGAQQAYAQLRKGGRSSPLIDNLGCEILRAGGKFDEAASCYRTALKAYPQYRAYTYGFAELLLENGKPQMALQAVKDRLRLFEGDQQLYLIESRAYAMEGKTFDQHRALGEAYYRMGNLPGAIEQLQIAEKSGGGDFYQMSAVEARLRELRKMDAENKRDQKQR
jgi:predicted Zn-dependent protease